MKTNDAALRTGVLRSLFALTLLAVVVFSVLSRHRSTQALSAASDSTIHESTIGDATTIEAAAYEGVSLPAPGKWTPGRDGRLWGGPGWTGDRTALLRAIEHSQRYLRTRRAAIDYQRQFHVTKITRSRVQRSLTRFAQLLRSSNSSAQFEAAVAREFVLYQPAVNGNAAFTGYYEPVVTASRTRTAVYRYPLYRLPPMGRWPRPHPTRGQLEGADGLQQSPYLRGRELVWLRDRLDAFLVQVQGSARLRLTDGGTMTIGYAGTTSWPYTSVGRELVKDGKMRFEELTLPALVDYFRAAPHDLSKYLPRNRRFVFFRERKGAPTHGSIGVPLTAERSIATDKSMHPPGALARIEIHVTNPAAARVLKSDSLTRYVLDQDTGSAIRGAGRVDVFMGTGQQAQQRAGVINSRGNLFYLLLKK